LPALARTNNLDMKTVNKLIFPCLTMVLILVSQAVIAGGNPGDGKQKAATCEACHGKDGHSVDPNYPDLAGQHESYLIKALSDYRAGRRSNVIMGGFASQLSNQDIQDLAAWYSSQPGLKDLSVR
jgi:cytochrome c553